MSSWLRAGAMTGALVAGVLAPATTATAAAQSVPPAGGSPAPGQIDVLRHPQPPPVAGASVRHQGRKADRPALPSVESVLSPVAPAGPRCDDSQPRGLHPRYDGGSVSALYDQLFKTGATLPYLHSYVPKALRTWTDWDGAGHDLILLGMYRLDHPSYLVGLDPHSGKVLGTLTIKQSHLAGMGFLRGWLFTQDDSPRDPWNHHPKVRRYRVGALRAAMERSVESGKKVHLNADGPTEAIDAVDFFTVDGDSIYAGNHGNPGPGRMYRYQLSPAGHLRQVEGPWAIPPRVQGMVMTPDDFIFSSDDDVKRGKLSVVRRAAADQTDAPIACVFVPAMPENMTIHNGQLLLSFESGTKRYEHDHPVNHITHLQVAPLALLMATADPTELVAEPTLGGLLPAAVRLPSELRATVSEAAATLRHDPTDPTGTLTLKSGLTGAGDAVSEYNARLSHVDHLLTSLGQPTPTPAPTPAF